MARAAENTLKLFGSLTQLCQIDPSSLQSDDFQTAHNHLFVQMREVIPQILDLCDRVGCLGLEFTKGAERGEKKKEADACEIENTK